MATSNALGQERSRRLVGGIASSFVSRGIGLVAPIVMIPLALSSLGAERYGLWAAATSLTAMALFSDFGLGNGLMTRLSATYVSGDTLMARQFLVAGICMTSAVAGAILVATMAIVTLADPVAWIDPQSTIPAAEGDLVIALCFAAFAVNIPLSLVHRVQYAYQQVSYSNIWSAGASLASLAAFATAAATGAGPTLLIACAVFAPPLVNLVNGLTYFRWRRPDLSPAKTRPTTDRTANLFRLGGAFFGLSIITSIALNVDPILISRELGLEAAASYAVVFRISSAVGLLVALVNLPLWPANGEALARGDLTWVRKSTARMVLISGGLVAVTASALLLVGGPVFSFWLGDAAGLIDADVLAWLMLWTLLLACLSPVFMVQNAAGLVAPQVVGWILFLGISVPAKWGGLQVWGMEAAPAVACFSYIVAVVPAALIGMRVALERAQRRQVPLSADGVEGLEP